MIDNYNPEDFERLKQEVETLVGRSVKTPKDLPVGGINLS